MGLIGTAIYARQELTKIILAQQASEQADTSIAEEAALQHTWRQSTIEGSLSLKRDGNSSGSLRDLENPQLGDSLQSVDEDEPSNHTIRRVDSERSLCSGGLRADRTENNAFRDRPWSPKAIAFELPIVPHLFRRRHSFEVLQSPGNSNTITSVKELAGTSSPEKPELDAKLNDVSEMWEQANNHRYIFKGCTNRTRSNTDPVASQRPSSKTKESPKNEENNLGNQATEISIRRMHSMADFESIRSMNGECGDLNTTPGKLCTRQSTDVDERIVDREWFWIWD